MIENAGTKSKKKKKKWEKNSETNKLTIDKTTMDFMIQLSALSLSLSCGEVCVSGSIVDYDYDIHKITPTATDLLFRRTRFIFLHFSVFSFDSVSFFYSIRCYCGLLFFCFCFIQLFEPRCSKIQWI